MDTSTPPHDGSGRPQQIGARPAPVSDGVGQRVEIPLVPASEAEVIAALGRAFHAACARIEGR